MKLSSIRIGGIKSNKQLSTADNITKFYNLLEKVIKSYSNHFKLVHNVACDAKHEKESKY